MTPRVLPKIIIDARMVEAIPHGIARYVTRLASGLRALAPLSYAPVFLVARGWKGADFSGFPVVRTDVPFLAGQEPLQLGNVINGLEPALYHSPSFSSLPTFGPGRLTCPWVQTVHDLNHLHYGDWSKKLYYRLLLRPFARRAAALLTVSEFSRQELAKWVGYPEEKIAVVPNALEPDLLEAPEENASVEILSKFGLARGQYFFCLSNAKPHKNLALLVRAYARYVGERSRPLVLSTARDPAWPSGVQAIGALTDLETRVLRAHGRAVVFPSLYEGFGLPPVEAVLAGVPVIVSRIPPHFEGLRDLEDGEALWVDPQDEAGWAQAFQRAERGEVASASLASRKKILARYGEAALAGHMDRIYRAVLGL